MGAIACGGSTQWHLGVTKRTMRSEERRDGYDTITSPFLILCENMNYYRTLIEAIDEAFILALGLFAADNY